MPLNTKLTLVIAIVATIIGYLLDGSRRKRERRLTSKEGYSLPPGPPAPRFWGNVVPRSKSDSCLTLDNSLH